MEKLNNFQNICLIFKYSIRDLSRSFKKLLSIILTLFISLFILSSIFTIENGLKNELKNNSKLLLGGDLEIDFNSEEPRKNLITDLKKFSHVTEIVKFSTMVSVTNNIDNVTTFTRINSVDKNYPLYGKVDVEPKDSLLKLNQIENTIVVNEKIFKKLNLKINQNIKIQNKDFRVVGVVKSLPDIGGAFVFGDFALTGIKTIENLQLKTLGNFLNYEYKIKFYKNITFDHGLEKVKEIFYKDKVKIKYPENSAIGLKKFIGNFSQFLSLISISAMLIAGIGISNTLLSFINNKNISISILKAIGFSSRSIKLIFYLEFFILLLLVSLFSYVLSLLLIPIVNIFLNQELGFIINSTFSAYIYLRILITGTLIMFVFIIPSINSVENISVSILFRNIHQNFKYSYSKKTLFSCIFFIIVLMIFISINSYKPFYTLVYFLGFFICLSIFYFLSTFFIIYFKKKKLSHSLSIKIATKNIIHSKSITSITMMSLGIGITLLVTLVMVGSNFKREISKSIPDFSPDYFFIGIQDFEKDSFRTSIVKSDKNSILNIVPIASAAIVKINNIDPHTYIKEDNDSYWVLRNDRRISWSNYVPKNNFIVKGEWWDKSNNNQLQISIDDKIANDFKINLNDIITLNVYGKELDGKVQNLRQVNYGDLSINFAILINPSFGKTIPHEYLSTVKFKTIEKFDELSFIKTFPNISIIKISDYLVKVVSFLKNIFLGVSFVSFITLIVGLMVISSAILVQGKIKVFQNLVFKIVGISKKQILFSSIYEFLIIFVSVIIFSTIFGVIISKYIMENIFMLSWKFDLIMYLNVIICVFIVTSCLIYFTNLKYLSPKVYPLVRNE